MLTQYDFVIVDTPPLLLISDSLVLLSKVDLGIFVLNTEKATKAGLKHLEDVLLMNNLKKNALMLNNIKQKRWKYYYGKYAYRYGYGYGYGYGYKYSYGYKYGYKYNYGYNYTDYESYTDDEDEENEAANAEGKEKRGPSMASRVLPNLIPRIQTKRLPSKPASETKPPETPEST